MFRINAEKQRNTSRLQNIQDLDEHRLKVSDEVFEKMFKKRQRQREMINKLEPIKDPRCIKYPMKYENIVVAMKRKKLERDCEKRQRYDFKINYKP